MALSSLWTTGAWIVLLSICFREYCRPSRAIWWPDLRSGASLLWFKRFWRQFGDWEPRLPFESASVSFQVAVAVSRKKRCHVEVWSEKFSVNFTSFFFRDPQHLSSSLNILLRLIINDCSYSLEVHSSQSFAIPASVRASSYEPGQPGWLGFRDLASPLFSL